MFTILHTSPQTKSEWQIEFGNDFAIERAYLNGKRVKVTPKRDERIYQFLEKNYDLEGERRLDSYMKKIEQTELYND